MTHALATICLFLHCIWVCCMENILRPLGLVPWHRTKKVAASFSVCGSLFSPVCLISFCPDIVWSIWPDLWFLIGQTPWDYSPCHSLADIDFAGSYLHNRNPLKEETELSYTGCLLATGNTTIEWIWGEEHNLIRWLRCFLSLVAFFLILGDLLRIHDLFLSYGISREGT